MGDLVIMRDNNIYITSQALAIGVNHSHETVIRLIRNSSDLPQLSDLKSEGLKTKGRAAEVFYLDEEQATLVIMLMKNSPVVRVFKSTLIKEFYKQRRLLEKWKVTKEGIEYQQQRLEGKKVRLEETDWIKTFVNYATDQGSKSAHMYYMNISKMENQALFFLDQKVKNVREFLDFKQLGLVRIADMAVIEAIKEGIKSKMYYKDIFKLAKDRVEMLTKIIPKSPIELLIGND